VTIELGVKIGLALCIMEIIAIALHVVALTMPTRTANDT
jgi:hypothetical protein